MPDTITNQKPPLSAVIKQAFLNLLKDVHTVAPGIIVEFNDELQSAKVQVAIQRVFVTKDSEGNETEKFEPVSALINVPVMFDRAGGWAITFPVKPGDECMVYFSERAFDIWRKEGGVQRPAAWRMHDYSDAICRVSLFSEPNVISNFDPDNLQIRNDAGDVAITLKSDKEIEIKTPLTVQVITPLAEFSNDVNIHGNLVVDGTSTADDHISDGISGKGHVHGGVESGGSNTSGPQ